jgi:hypothetical protein
MYAHTHARTRDIISFVDYIDIILLIIQKTPLMLTHRGGFTIIMSLGLRYCTFACYPNDTYKNNATSDKIYFKNADR